MPSLIPVTKSKPAYFTQTESDGRVALWFGLDLNDPSRTFICWADTPASADALAERLALGEVMSGLHALTGWRIKDITEAYGVTPAEAHAFLEDIEGEVIGAQEWAGWAIIEKRRDWLPDARTKQQKADWDRAQEDADERDRLTLLRW